MKKTFDDLSPEEALVVNILYLAQVSNYHSGQLTEDEIFLVCNYAINNNVNLIDITDKSQDNVEYGINFFNLALNRN
jgi:hypothetical protein